jgi:O-antigen/teichoic acid export membrane protein
MLAGFGLYAVRVLGLTRKPFPFGKLASFSWPLSIGNLVSFAYNWFDRAVLIALVPLASLGVYNAALYAFGAVSSISGSFGNTLLPFYSGVGRGRGLEGCRRVTWLASRYVSLVTVPLAFGLLATAKPALTLFVGEAYVGGVVPVMILSLAFGLTAVGLALGPMLTALAKTQAIMFIGVASAVLGLVTAYALLPSLGIVGASVARDVATFASLGLTMFALKRMRAMRVDLEMAWKSLVASAVMAVAVIVIQMIVYSRLLLPVYILFGAFVYLILLRVLNAVKQHDIELVDRYLGSRLAFISRLLSRILVP